MFLRGYISANAWLQPAPGMSDVASEGSEVPSERCHVKKENPDEEAGCDEDGDDADTDG